MMITGAIIIITVVVFFVLAACIGIHISTFNTGKSRYSRWRNVDNGKMVCPFTNCGATIILTRLDRKREFVYCLHCKGLVCLY